MPVLPNQPQILVVFQSILCPVCPTGEDAGLDLTLAHVKMAQPVPCLFIWVVGISHPALAGPGLSEEPRTEAVKQRAQSAAPPRWGS